jgi:hypothetical protein
VKPNFEVSADGWVIGFCCDRPLKCPERILTCDRSSFSKLVGSIDCLRLVFLTPAFCTLYAVDGLPVMDGDDVGEDVSLSALMGTMGVLRSGSATTDTGTGTGSDLSAVVPQ